jgi:hypothetical protein
MKAFNRNLNLGLRIPIALLIASIMTVLAWGGEHPSTSDAVTQPVSPQDFALSHDFLDPNLLNYGNVGTDSSGRGRKLTAPKPAPPGQKGVGLDVKTDYDVDVQKFLPTDGFPLYAPSGNGSAQTGATQKKGPFFFGLSVTKPLN